MANYVTANLVKAQAILTGKFQSGELRFRDPVVFKSLVRGAQIMFPNYDQLRLDESRAVETNFKIRSSRALGAARAHNHTGVKGDSAILTPSWTPNTDKFVSSLKSGGSSVYNHAEQIAGEMENIIANFAEGLESDSADFLFNNRSGVNGASVQGTFNVTKDAFEITNSSDGTEAIQITKSMMKENKYNGVYDIYCDTRSFNRFELDANQGSGNSTNLSFQYSNVNFIHSVEMDALAATQSYALGFWIAVPQGMAAALPWIPIQNRTGHSDNTGEYSSFNNPVDGQQYAVHTYKERFDGTTVNSQTQDVKDEFEFSLDLAFDHAPLTTANETPLLAVALV